MEKNNSRVCKICDKCFSSGKAMGGHMRSHLAKLPIPPKQETKNQALDNSVELTHSPLQSPSQNLHPETKPTENIRSLKFSSFASFPYPKNPTRKRSKCRRRFISAAKKKAQSTLASWISDSETIPAVEAARSLVLLSNDKWHGKEISTQNMEEANKKEAKDDGNGTNTSLAQTQTPVRFKNKMRPKMFRSHQALPGHNTKRRKVQNLCQEGSKIEDGGSSNITDVVDQKAVKCPDCFKVFKSAQALGGHKKVHLSNSKVVNANTNSDNFCHKSLDLNIPAPREDEE